MTILIVLQKNYMTGLRRTKMRDILLRATRKHLEGHLEKHIDNIEILINNPVGIGEHGDIMEEIEKELDLVSKYDDMIDSLDTYFE